MEDRPISTRPPSRRDELIQERYIEDFARQSAVGWGEGRTPTPLDVGVRKLTTTYGPGQG